MIILSIFASIALASEPMTLSIPTLGVTLVAQAGGCDFTVVGTVSARKAGELSEALASAKSECLAAEAHGTSTVSRAPAEAKLIGDAGAAILIGHNVRVRTPEGLEVEGGSHLDWTAYGEALTSGNPGLYAPGVMPAGGDPNLYRLAGGSMGSLHLVTPPPVQVAAATAECGTAAECQTQIAALSAVLANEE